MSGIFNSDDHLKDLFEGFDPMPSPHTWDRISNHLDRQVKGSAGKGYSKWLIAISFFLGALSVISLNFIFPDYLSKLNNLNKKSVQTASEVIALDQSRSFPEIINDQSKTANTSGTDRFSSSVNSSNTDNNVSFSTIPTRKLSLFNRINGLAYRDFLSNNLVLPAKSILFTKGPAFGSLGYIKPVNLKFVDMKDDERSTGENTVGPKSNLNELRSTMPKGLYLGSIFTLNNIWIINQNTHDEFEGYELDYFLDYGKSYGLVGGYDFSDHWGIQLEWHLNSQQGQKYEDYIGRKNVRREVDLNYTKIPIYLTYKISKVGGAFGLTPVSLNIALGGYVGLLKMADINNDGTKVNAQERFNKTDYGLALQVGYDKYLSKYISISAGVVGNLGLHDINATGWRVDDDFGQSLNALLGVHAGIKYHFRK